jgi:DNA-binding GntR family transcriptional regulator
MLTRTISAVDQVIASIELAIQEARYAPGQRLIEPELMMEFGVSRGPIREALRRLGERGLIESERFRGARVIRMSRRQVVDLTEIRVALERYATSLAAERIDRKGATDLRQLERKATQVVDNSVAYDQYNVAFHAMILRLSGNRELPDFIDRTRFSIFRLQFNKLLLSPKRMPHSRAEHAHIAEAILDKDSRAAAERMAVHIRNTTRGILDAPDHFFEPDQP